MGMNELLEDYEIWSGTTQKGSFLKVKLSAFGIGKVMLTFANTGAGKKLLKSVDIYMSLEEALGFASQILNGIVANNISNGKIGYSSKIGGTDKDENGETIQRRFYVEKAMRDDYFCCFTGVVAPARRDAKGIFIKLPNATETKFYVPCKFNELYEMAAYIDMHCRSFLSYSYGTGYEAAMKELREKNKKKNEQPSNQQVQSEVSREIEPKKLQPAVKEREIIKDFYYSKDKGCGVVYRGTQNEILVLKLVTEAVDKEGAGVFKSNEKLWQSVELVFQKAVVEKNFSDEVKETLSAIKENRKVPNLKNLQVKIGAIREGLRQFEFCCKAS